MLYQVFKCIFLMPTLIVLKRMSKRRFVNVIQENDVFWHSFESK